MPRSHIGDALEGSDAVPTGQEKRLIEVNLGDGCVAVPLSKYESYKYANMQEPQDYQKLKGRHWSNS